MRVIIIEGVLFVAIFATAGALFYYLILQYTSVGTRIRQRRNRRRIDRAAPLACPIHGTRAQDALVRLPDGTLMCPDCYQETLS